MVGFRFASCSAINSLGDLERIASDGSYFTASSRNEVLPFREEICWQLGDHLVVCNELQNGVAFHPPVMRCGLLCYTGVKSSILHSSVRLLC